MPTLFGLGMGITLTVPSSKRVHYSGSLGLVLSLCMCTFIISSFFSLNKEFQNSVFSIHSSIHRLTNTDLDWTMLEEESEKTTLKKPVNNNITSCL